MILCGFLPYVGIAQKTVTISSLTDAYGTPATELCAYMAPTYKTYRVKGTFSSSFYPGPAEIQLSDINGNFTAPGYPKILATSLSTNGYPNFTFSGSIYQSDPASAFNGLPSGTGYKIRIKMRDVDVNQDFYSNLWDVSVNGGVTTPVIQPHTNPQALCVGTWYTYNIADVPNATSFEWQLIFDNYFNISPATNGEIEILSRTQARVRINSRMSNGSNGFRVRALNDCGTSDYSAITQVGPQLELPPLLSLTGEADVSKESSYTYTSEFSSYYGGVADYTWAYSGTGATIPAGNSYFKNIAFLSTATSGTLSVTATNGCQTSGPLTKSINVIQVKTTAQDGDWDVASTWVGNEVPLVSEPVKIDHHVTLTASAQCKTLHISATGRLSMTDYDMTIGEAAWDGTQLAPCGQYFMQIDGTFEMTGGALHVGGTINKGSSGIFRMSGGLVQVKRGGCGGNFNIGNSLVYLPTAEGDVTGGIVEILGNTGTFKGIYFSNFGPNTTIRIGKAGTNTFFTGTPPDFTRIYLPITLNRVGNVEIYNVITSGGAIKPNLLSGGSLDLVRIRGNLFLQSFNTILVGDETNFSTPATMGISIIGNLTNNAASLEMASGRMLFFGGEGSYDVFLGRPYCTIYGSTPQSIAGSGTITGMTCNCNSAGMVLGGPITLPLFTLGGRMILGNHDLTINNLKVEANTSGYIETNGTGKLRLKYVTGSIQSNVFPVGTESGPAPVTITYPSSPNAEVAVSVKNTFTNAAPTTKAVALEWNITSNVSAPANVTFKWNASNESPGFNRNSLAISRFNGSAWEVRASGLSASGTGPYSASINGVTQFSPWAIFDSQAALPVTLASFLVKKEEKNALLEWTTTEETNSDRFEIEQSSTTKSWLKIGSVISGGESKVLKYYNYTHTDPFPGENFYRLKMIDADGSFTYSRIKSVDFANDVSAFIYPNPVSDRLFLGNTKGIRSVKILDIAGKEVLKTTEINALGIQLKHLAAGAYITNIEKMNGEVNTYKIVIKP